MQIENKSGQGQQFRAIIGEAASAKIVEVRLSRSTAVAALEEARRMYAAAKPAEQATMTDPESIIDPYTLAKPVASIDLAKLAKAEGVEEKALLAALRKSAYFKGLEADGRLVIVGEK